ncbi:MAG TPA: transporter, partial [Vicinamibacteria bacterium]
MVSALGRKAAAMIMAGLIALTVPAVSHGQQTESAPAQPAQAGDAELAKKLSNPISDLVSVPFQFNWEQGVGPDDQTRFILNVQPVMPFTLNEDWNMIARVIVPLVSQPALFEGGAPASGVSDILTSFFFSPSKGGLTWGVGPVISLPSTTEPTLGTEKWSAGPTVVALKQQGPWTYGALWNQLWSFSGNSERNDVNQMFLQPFLAYNTESLWTFTLQSEMTANWEADEDQWTVPINVLVAKLSSFG